MADYTPIPLQVQVPDQMQKLSGMLNMAQGAQNYRLGQDTYDAKVLNANSTASSAQSKATVDAANVNPLIQEQAATTSSAQTKAASDKFGLQKDYMGTALQTASGLINDPRLQAGPNYKDADAAKAISEAQRQMVAKGVPEEQAAMATAPLYMKVHEPGAVQQALKNTITGNLGPAGQVGAATPNYLGTGGQYTNVNPLQTPPQPTINGTVPVGDQHTLGNDVNGNPVVLNKSPQGMPQAPSALPSPNGSAPPAPLTAYPAGESPQTKTALEQEALGAKNTAQGAPQMHDINRSIVQEAENLKNGGTLGQLTQKLSSATGFNVGNESATGYNLLGKMLERSALTAAQSQGPHTNAGLEASVRANGSLDYTPDSLKTIARLNDALTTGSEKYAQGMQAAIDSGGSVFAKRKFDQQWAANAHVDALKLLSATKAGDQEGVQAVLKSVGGAGSAGAKDLAKKLQNLQSLSTKGSL